jgi:hypothetical protein
MHIIEPHQIQQRKLRPDSANKLPLRIAFLVTLVIGAGGLLMWRLEHRSLPLPAIAQQEEAEEAQTGDAGPPKPLRLKQFSNEQFRDLYNSFAYPNTAEIAAPPVITGNSKADKRIRDLAFGRGYKLRSAPVSPLVTTEDGFALQQKAVKPWHDLKRAAAREGIPLGLASAYRSIEEQRLIFLQGLKATGVTPEEVAAGLVDDKVIRVLATTSIPGASRHHTGFAVDLKCSDEDHTLFVHSKCFAWLSNNNYEKAKRYGWIPSYPPGTPNQGPEPEAWEYVWVGIDTLSE